MRGYFQGYADMMPSAMSQFVEQFARVAWMLLTAYVIMQVQHGNFVDAVVQSNFAAAAAIKSNLAQKILGDKIVPLLAKLHIKA